MSEPRFDCPELGFYNMTDAEMVASLQEDAAKGDAYAAACLRARGIKPEGRAQVTCSRFPASREGDANG